MNGTSFLLLLVFLVAGYVIQPLTLPKLQESGYGTTKTDDVGKKKKATDDTDTTAKNNAADAVKPRITDEPAPDETAKSAKNGDSANSNPMPKLEPKPEPKLEPEPGSGSRPEPKPEPKSGSTALTEAQLVNAMQSSIKSGSITEFQFAQVKDWKFSGEETINGQSYKVGVASYTAKTLFGDQTHEAKALFKDGKLVKWVWAANNFEMK